MNDFKKIESGRCARTFVVSLPRKANYIESADANISPRFSQLLDLWRPLLEQLRDALLCGDRLCP